MNLTHDEVPSIQVLPTGQYILDSKLLIKEVNDLLGLEIDDEDIDTIGGWILTENYDVKVGDLIEKEGYTFKVIEMEDHTIKSIEVTKKEEKEDHSKKQRIHLKNPNIKRLTHCKIVSLFTYVCYIY